jgi:hypothetical protein
VVLGSDSQRIAKDSRAIQSVTPAAHATDSAGTHAFQNRPAGIWSGASAPAFQKVLAAYHPSGHVQHHSNQQSAVRTSAS